jgi:L-ascorbate oxidase
MSAKTFPLLWRAFSLQVSVVAVALGFGFQSTEAATIAEPPVLSSSNGVLDILMVAQPLQNVAGITGLTGWSYTICPTSTATTPTTCPAAGGASQTQNSYGGIRLALQPGDNLKITLVNNLPTLNSISSFSPVSSLPPITQTLDRLPDDPLLALNPTDLHTHGLIVTAAANTVSPPAIPVYGDFVLTAIFNPTNGDPATYNSSAYNELHAHYDIVTGGVAKYNIQIPSNHPPGIFWIHPHIHGSSVNQLAAGLSGIITIGKVGSYACADELCRLPVPDKMVRHLILKDMQAVTVTDASATGTVGAATTNALLQQDPGFCGVVTSPSPNGSCPGDASASSAYKGGVWNFTVNGQLYPNIPVATPDGEVWRFTNASPLTTYDIKLLTDLNASAQGRPLAVQLIAIDGVSVSFPTNAVAGQVVQEGKFRYTLASCGTLKQTYSTAPVCASDLYMMGGTRVEVFVAYRDANGNRASAPTGTKTQLITAGVATGGPSNPQNGDIWPAISLASVVIPTGSATTFTENIHIKNGGALAVRATGGIFQAKVSGATATPLPAGCQPLAAGRKRRIYFGNPNTVVGGTIYYGTDQYGTAIFGLGYEEIDSYGIPVPGTFQEVSRFDPANLVCLPLNQGQYPAVETWELVNLTQELHNFHIHQTKFRIVDPGASIPTSSLLYIGATNPGMVEDSVPLPVAVAGPGSQPVVTDGATPSCTVADYKAGRCTATPITVQIPFAKLGTFVFHCHVLEHEDGGMMRAIRVVPSPN